MKRIHLRLVQTLVLMGLSVPASATLIVGGSVSIIGYANPTFDIFGENWELRSSGLVPFGFFAACSPCFGSINVNGGAYSSDFIAGPFFVEGIAIPAGFINANAPNSFIALQGPAVSFSGAGTWTGPFTLAGRLCGWVTTAPWNACPIYYPDLQGQGTVSVVIAPLFDTGLYRFVSATYVFDPIPEPSSLFLVAPAMAALLYRRSK